jgi:oligopeptide/dipeptide ABC transporter ATP-binding protein
MTDEEFRRAIRWRAMSMVFQSAMNSLNPVMRVGRLLLEAIQFHDRSLSRSEAGERVSELFVAVGLRKEDLRRYPHEMSGGMRQRAVIALSLVASPQIVIADEATTALDVLIQDQILLTLLELREKRGLSLLVVSHDIDVIAKVCDEVLVMYAGRIVEQGPTADVLRNPAHPYTAGLLAALPTLRGRKRRLPALPRRANHPAGDARGCRFAPLCSLAEDICWSIEPELPDTKRAARCHFAGDSRIRDAFADDVS